MKNYFKKFNIMFVIALMLVLGCCVSAFAADDSFEIGEKNLNNTPENSAVVNKGLSNPEKGWKRYDDNNSEIVYEGKGWEIAKGDKYYKGEFHYTNAETISSNEKVKFEFYGTKIRILSKPCKVYTKMVNCYIDGNKATFNLYSDPYPDDIILVYEKTGLNLGKHIVEFEADSSDFHRIGLDAIDIDDTGYLVKYDEAISLNKSTMELTKDTSEQLIATTTPAGVQVAWKSSDESIATVDQTGKVTAIKEGQATITATTTDGSNLSASCVVTVIPKNVVPTDSETIVNIAHAKGDNTNTGGGAATIIFKGLPDTTLNVVKTADVQSVYVGDTFTYTIVVTNTGSKIARSVVFTDSAPNHIDFLVNGITTTQGKVDPSSTSKSIIVNLGDIPPLGTVTIKIPSNVIL